MLMLLVRQACLWPWQQPEPHKPTTPEQPASKPQQHIFTNNLQPFVSGPSHLAASADLPFTLRQHGAERRRTPIKPEPGAD